MPDEKETASIDSTKPGALLVHKPIEVFVQNAAAWGGLQLGNPSSEGHVLSIGGAGCLLTCMCIVYGFLTGKRVTPPDANERFVKNGAFSGPLLIVEQAAHVLGLVAKESERFRSTVSDNASDKIRELVNAAFAAGKVCILHVDTNSAVGGDKYGEHFVVAFERQSSQAGFCDVLFCGDPAPGKTFPIDMGSMQGLSTWVPASLHREAVVKHMKVVGVIPVSLPQGAAA